MRLLRSALLATLVAAVTWAIAAVPAHAQATVVIDSVDTSASQFQPANVTIDAGDTVRWEFDQAATTHNVTSNTPNWTIAESRAPNGEAITRRFDTPGVYGFVCTIHNGMTGSVTVEAADAHARARSSSTPRTVGFRHDSIPAGITMLQRARRGQRLHGHRDRGPDAVHRGQPRAVRRRRLPVDDQ